MVEARYTGPILRPEEVRLLTTQSGSDILDSEAVAQLVTELTNERLRSAGLPERDEPYSVKTVRVWALTHVRTNGRLGLKGHKLGRDWAFYRRDVVAFAKKERPGGNPLFKHGKRGMSQESWETRERKLAAGRPAAAKKRLETMAKRKQEAGSTP